MGGTSKASFHTKVATMLINLITALVISGLLISVCDAHPAIIVHEGESRCFLFEAAMDTTIIIDYEAPGEYEYNHPMT